MALGGENMDVTTSAIVASAERTETRRIITINAGGIYGELPEPFETWDHAQVGSFRPILRRAADVVEQSSLAFTILRPVWLTDDENTDYELTRKGQSSPAPRLHARVSAPSSPYLSNTLTPTSGKAWASRGPAPTGAGPPPTAESGDASGPGPSAGVRVFSGQSCRSPSNTELTPMYSMQGFLR